jgi:hypothetical protein
VWGDPHWPLLLGMRINRLFALSLASNLALALIVGMMIWRWPDAAHVPVGHDEGAPISPPPTAVVAPAPPPAAQPFRWSQLESADYQTYIANLRAIGCPEQTIGDIVRANLDNLYAPKRRELEAQQKLAQFQPQTLKTLADEKQNLATEEGRLVAELLGPGQNQTASTSAINEINSTPQTLADAKSQSANQFKMPAIFANVPSNSLNLSPTQQTLLDGLRNQFVNQLGGPGADPNSPDYAARWQEAQPRMDQNLKVLLGWQVYRQLHGLAGQ